jgi:uncharacterized membrane protein
MASLGVLIYFIQHVTASIQAGHSIASIIAHFPPDVVIARWVQEAAPEWRRRLGT